MLWKAHGINDRPVAVIGAGVLGRRIACLWAAAGYKVVILDPSEDQRISAIYYIDKNLSIFSRTLSIPNKRPGNYTATDNLVEAVSKAWFVIEAIPEELDLKITTLSELAPKVPHDCILGTSSSSYKSRLLIRKVDELSKRRCLNVHYTMLPENRSVELMTSTYTDDNIFSFLVEKHKSIGLLPVVARKESTGFIIGRLLDAVKREALQIVAEGVTNPEELDNLWMEMIAGSKIGPCAMMDADGLETVAIIEENYTRERHLDGTNTVDFLRNEYIRHGKLGGKSDKGGFYPPRLAAPTLYILDLGHGEDADTTDLAHSGRILIASADGHNMRTLIGGLEAPDGIDISLTANRIFWTNMGNVSKNNGSVQSALLDGSDVRGIIKEGDVHTPKQITIDHANNKLYFSDREGLRVHRANFDGSDHEILVQNGDFNNSAEREDQTKWCVGICLDIPRGKFYWTQKGFSKSGKGRIFRANIDMPDGDTALNRSDTELIFGNLPEPIDLEIDSKTETLYWTDRGEFPFGNTVNRANVAESRAINGIEPRKYEVLTRHLHEAIGLRLDLLNKYIYFTDLGGAVYRTDLDGKNKVKIYDTPSTFTGLAVVHLGRL